LRLGGSQHEAAHQPAHRVCVVCTVIGAGVVIMMLGEVLSTVVIWYSVYATGIAMLLGIEINSGTEMMIGGATLLTAVGFVALLRYSRSKGARSR
jgi:hypothetical protein